MTAIWVYSLLSVVLVSAVSFVGALALVFNEGVLKRLLFYMVSFSSGALLGDVVPRLLPEYHRL